MPKATKKTVKKTTRKLSNVIPSLVEESIVSTPTPSFPKPRMNSKVISLALVVVVLGLLTYKVGPWLVPAYVAGHPITRFEIWSRLEKAGGTQTLDDMVSEKILDKAIADAHIKVDQSKIDTEIKNLEKQYEANGGLDKMLAEQGITRKDLMKNFSTRFAMEELLADKISPTDDEVKKQFDGGVTTLYKDKKFEDVKETIKNELKQTKLREAFLAWFADVKKNASVKNFGL